MEVQRKGNENGICKIVGVGYRDLCGMRPGNGLFASLPGLPTQNDGGDICGNSPIGFDIKGPYGALFVYKRGRERYHGLFFDCGGCICMWGDSCPYVLYGGRLDIYFSKELCQMIY